jgi:WD40 repeat protein
MQWFSMDTLALAKERISIPPGTYLHGFDEKSSTYVLRLPQAAYSVWSYATGVSIKAFDLPETTKSANWPEYLDNSDAIAFGLAIGTLDAGVVGALRTLRVYRLTDGVPVGPELSFPGPMADSPNINPDGTRIALGGSNGVAGVWEIATGRQLVSFKTNTLSSVHVAQFSPDGKVIATGTYADRTPSSDVHAEARLWDAQTGEPRSPVYRQRENFSGAAYSLDNKLVALVWSNGIIDVVSTVTGRPVCPALVHPDPFTASTGNFPVQFQGASSVVTTTAKMASWWDARSGLLAMEPFRASKEPIENFDVDPKARFMALIEKSGRVSIWSVPPRYETTGVPPWLLRLARALGGKRLDNLGALVPSELGFEQTQADLAAVRQELSVLPDDAPYAAWGRWILADPHERSIAPGLNITVAEARERGLTD